MRNTHMCQAHNCSQQKGRVVAIELKEGCLTHMLDTHMCEAHNLQNAHRPQECTRRKGLDSDAAR